MGYYYHDGVGLDKDLAEQLAKRSSCRFELKVMLRSRIWQEMQDGNVDMTFSAVATPERTAFAWPAPCLWFKNVIILNKDAGQGLHSAEDFIATPNLRVGLVRGYIGSPYNDFLSQLRNIARVEEVEDVGRLYSMLKVGRFQAVISSYLVYAYYLKDPVLAEHVQIVDWAPNAPQEAINLLISKKKFSQEESKRWSEVLKNINADGTMLKLLNSYAPPEVAAKMLGP
jgi:polar amino acid transport system substrate-binding protein